MAAKSLQPLADPKRRPYVLAALRKREKAQRAAALADEENRARALRHITAIQQLLGVDGER